MLNFKNFSEAVDDIVDDELDLVDEALTTSQRIKAKQRFKRVAAKIKRGRERAKKRLASGEKLKARADKQARSEIAKKLLSGKDKKDLSFAARQSIEKRLEKRKGAIKRLSKKLLPKVRAKDRSKFKKDTDDN